jgi:hypothetical protein
MTLMTAENTPFADCREHVLMAEMVGDIEVPQNFINTHYEIYQYLYPDKSRE